MSGFIDFTKVEPHNNPSVKELVEWIGEHSFAEVLPYPDPENSVVKVARLLDYIAEVTRISKTQLGEWAGDLNRN